MYSRHRERFPRTKPLSIVPSYSGALTAPDAGPGTRYRIDGSGVGMFYDMMAFMFLMYSMMMLF